VLSPQPTTFLRGIPAQIWEQDTVHQIYLSKYFQDPDGDQLEYLVSETEHVDIAFSGNTAFFTPETGWTGEERVVIRAYDGKGGEIDSNTIVLRVQERAVPAHVQPYIGIVLALLTIILLLWIARSQQKRYVVQNTKRK